ncbi:MAG TPA: hypothetical protein PKO06_12340, partial [Candidatus Ozemobacteraceae bacterium]|nr:hypothetical protein [Candidatus Ozemobacteraceae bacterium]
RVSIRTTGMGRIVPIMDSPGLADAIVDVVRNRESYMRSRAQIEEHFSMGKTVREYERLFEMLIGIVEPATGPCGRRQQLQLHVIVNGAATEP